MSRPRIAAIMRTNLQKDQIPDEFLRRSVDCFVELFDTVDGDVVVELQTSVCMCSGGSDSPMMNVDIRHNSSKVKDAKVCLAEDVARFMNRQLDIPVNRTLVLFFDTKKCC